MIAFINFAPIDFMGGAEKLMLDISSYLNKNEETYLIYVTRKIANVYGKVVLGRKYDKRIDLEKIKDKPKLIELSFGSFIPFTNQFQKVKKILHDARLIYIRYEVLEVVILMWFGGRKLLSKTILGIHSPLSYDKTTRVLDTIHNSVYHSFLAGNLMRSTKYVHVMNKRDADLLSKKFTLTNIKVIPNGIDVDKPKRFIKNETKKVDILYVGELTLRKGIDTLIEIIKHAPRNYYFHIAGDGLLKENINELEKTYKNFSYYGHLKKGMLQELYSRVDIFLFPSRAESMSLAMIEAIAYGLKIVTSKEVSLNFPPEIEYVTKDSKYSTYLQEIARVCKNTDNKSKTKIRNYYLENYTKDIMQTSIKQKLFSL